MKRLTLAVLATTVALSGAAYAADAVKTPEPAKMTTSSEHAAGKGHKVMKTEKKTEMKKSESSAKTY